MGYLCPQAVYAQRIRSQPNAVSEYKYEDLKRALGLLENVFSQNFIMAEQQAKELFAVVKDYTKRLMFISSGTVSPLLFFLRSDEMHVFRLIR